MSKRVFLTEQLAEQSSAWLLKCLQDALFDVWQSGDISEIKPDLILMAKGQETQWARSLHVPIVFISDTWQVGADDCVPADGDLLVASLRTLLRQSQMRLMFSEALEIAHHHGLLAADQVSTDPARLLVFAEEADHSILEIHLHERHHVFGPSNIMDPEAIIIKDDLDKLIHIASHSEAQKLSILFWSEDKEKIIRALDAGISTYIPDLAQSEPRITKQIHHQRKMLLLQQNLSSTLDMAAKDSLTGLYNRRCLTAHLPAMIKEVMGSDKKRLAVILLDLDRFKQVNDHWGHGTGDSILQHVAELLQQTLRSQDKLYRIGGEEFLGLIPNIASIEEAYRLAERLCKTISQTHFVIGEQIIPITISAGVSIFQPGERTQNLLKRADQALYMAKRSGRNQAA